MRHRVKKNVSETGFENGGWLGPTKDHAKKRKKKTLVICMTIQNNAYSRQYIAHASHLLFIIILWNVYCKGEHSSYDIR